MRSPEPCVNLFYRIRTDSLGVLESELRPQLRFFQSDRASALTDLDVIENRSRRGSLMRDVTKDTRKELVGHATDGRVERHAA